MTDTLPNVSVFGRPFKPVALGVTVLMLGLVIIPVFSLGDEGRDAFDWVTAAFALIAAVLLIVGWWRDRLRFAEWGLLCGVFAYLLRTTHLITREPEGDSVALAVGVLIVIAGSYVLEANDRRRIEWNR